MTKVNALRKTIAALAHAPIEKENALYEQAESIITELEELLRDALEHMEAHHTDLGLDLIRQRVRTALEKP